ncbi:uncharacterized protein LOC110030909 [Phalaenopsis equestris]|uniref:uncharacterized protein LOC110030909 n=1 Tax=Phalaenopsis equestris TaxID=78828 RepID=UPI0009E351CE|nr:uncharacterized protein LOC110030909 [Phalaenopsis equestris]
MSEDYMTAFMDEGITAVANGSVMAAFANGTVMASSVKVTSSSVGAASGTRRSARRLGKERPYYGNRRELAEEMVELPKKRKICQGRQVFKTSITTLKSNLALDGLSSYGRREPEEEETVASMKSMISRGKKVSQTSNDLLESKVGSDSVEFKHASVVNGAETRAKVCLLSNQWKDKNGISSETELNTSDECGDSEKAFNGSNKSAYMRVKETLRTFNTNYLQFVQEEELRVKSLEAQNLKISKESKSKGPKCDVDIKRASKRPDLKAITKVPKNDIDIKRASKRPDLKAISKMKSNGSVLYTEKMIGHIPGIPVGHQFFSRAEMVVLGIHSHWLNGIDYMGDKYAKLISRALKSWEFHISLYIERALLKDYSLSRALKSWEFHISLYIERALLKDYSLSRALKSWEFHISLYIERALLKDYSLSRALKSWEFHISLYIERALLKDYSLSRALKSWEFHISLYIERALLKDYSLSRALKSWEFHISLYIERALLKDYSLRLFEGTYFVLQNSMTCGVPVRVIRGHDSTSSYCGKVYTYDGLYKVIKYWAEKGVSGFTVFKYRLCRLEGQPTLTTNQVYYSRAQVPTSISELRGLVCDDISGGQENFPIPATNVVDDPPFPPSGGPTSVELDSGSPAVVELNDGSLIVVEFDGGSLSVVDINDDGSTVVDLNNDNLTMLELDDCGPAMECNGGSPAMVELKSTPVLRSAFSNSRSGSQVPTFMKEVGLYL